MIQTKSRHIPLTQLYSQLQLEFISYYIRSKIYCKEFAENYSKVCNKKKEKIEAISVRNNLPSIFNSSEIKERYLNKFFGENGIPNFTYKDEEIKEKMQRWDRFYYFCPGTSVSFGPEATLGVIYTNEKNSCVACVEDEFGNEIDLHYNNIRRLFAEDFFSF